jgi:hypothetical protein
MENKTNDDFELEGLKNELATLESECARLWRRIDHADDQGYPRHDFKMRLVLVEQRIQYIIEIIESLKIK